MANKTAPRDWSREAADALLNDLMPVLKAASASGDVEDCFKAYAGALGAWMGMLWADAGPEYAPQVAKLLFDKTLAMDLKAKLHN